MDIYFYTIFFWVILTVTITLSSEHKKDNSNTILLIIYSTTLLLLISLRKNTVGTDTMTYFYQYIDAEKILFIKSNNSESGFLYFNYFLRKMGVSFQWYLFIISSFFIFSISLLFKKFSKNFFLSFYLHITIGLFAMAMSGLRQTIAISLTILSFILLMKGKKILPFLLIIAGYYFHHSIIFFFLAFPVIFSKIKLSRKSAIITYCFSIFLFALKDIVKFIVEYFNLIGYESISRYERYFAEENFYTNPVVTVVAMAIPFISLFFWPKDISVDTKTNQHALSIFFLFSCINFIINYYSMDIFMLSRLGFYFIAYNAILIPNIIENIQNRNLRIWAKMACLIFPFIQFVMVTPRGALGIDNYKFFWE